MTEPLSATISLTISFRISTVMLTNVAVSIRPIKTFCKNTEPTTSEVIDHSLLIANIIRYPPVFPVIGVVPDNLKMDSDNLSKLGSSLNPFNFNPFLFCYYGGLANTYFVHILTLLLF